MSLPVSQYEALLAEVRGLRRKAQHVQQLAKPLIREGEHQELQGSFRSSNPVWTSDDIHYKNDDLNVPLDYTMDSLLLDRQRNGGSSPNYDRVPAPGAEASSEEEFCVGGARSSTQLSVSSEPCHRNRNPPSSLYHGTWPVERTMWNSEPSSLGNTHEKGVGGIETHLDMTSVMSFASSSGGVPLDRVLGSPDRSTRWSSQQLEAKMDVVHSLLSMLGSQDHVDMGETLLALSTCPESCLAMRQSGCIPLLVQLVQSDKDSDTRKKASQALHNLVNSQPDEKLRKREVRILKLIETTRSYTEALRNNLEIELESSTTSEGGDKHPVQTVAHLMKLSFDEGHRQAICQLGGIHTIASLVEAEHSMHGSTPTESHCILMRRYACMALTNLTFGDSGNKALLCSFRDFMRALVLQLQSPSDELRQVTASVLRNLSWRADSTSKEILRDVGSVTGLMKSAMLDNKENTLKSILSALWNLSAHCTENKSEICAVDGALGFLVTMLTYKTPSKSLAIIENSGGILRNISSQIAVRDDYREILRRYNCLQILLDQLKSPSLTIVSNACGTLWNLSAKCNVDQEALWQMGAPAMLRSLNHSKHNMIAMGSSAALKNLLSAKPQHAVFQQMDQTALSLNLPELPTLGARKQKSLLQDLDHSLSETYENIEKDSPVKSKVDKTSSIIDFMKDSHKPRSLKSCSPPEYLKQKVDDLSNAFTSLNLMEPSTSYTAEKKSRTRVSQNTNFGSTSLPYMSPIKHSSHCTYIPVRNKYSDCGYDEEIEASDQPIDYSRKYAETKSTNSNVLSSKNDNSNYSNNKTDAKDYSIYAETDLDQPTDYSLRYAEDDSDSDICSKISKQEYVQDTVKTYCTEGTPYETPFIFSNATSISDLRNMEDKQQIDNDIQKNKSPENKEVKNVDEKDRCSTEDISEIDNQKQNKSRFSSGLMSPEKPVNYCEEGTPGYFSRVSSFGSLNSIPANEPTKVESKQNETGENSPTEKGGDKPVGKITPKTPSEIKAVKFEQVVNYAEETPLMFSRSSSLASLDSIEQHSIHDDRSSVISDFSRLTSGIVSPSELPDSPTQTVPPSPRPRKTNSEYPSTSKRASSDGKSQVLPRTTHKASVFEDNITRFKEESTPIQFSTATSLSSLTIDDQDENETETSKTSVLKKQQNLSTNESATSVLERNSVHSVEEQEKQDKEKESSSSDINDELAQDSDDEGDEDILAACISDGMQNNRQEYSDIRHSQNNPSATSTPSRLPLSNFKYQPKVQVNANNQIHRRSPQSSVANITEEAPMTYCTEDTPAQLSRTGSNSNLSVLSLLNDNKSSKNYLSDDSSNCSGDNDNILAECIQSAMPKAKGEVTQSIPKQISSLPRPNAQAIKYNPPGVANVRREARKMQNIDKKDISVTPYLISKDELENYAVENSPCEFSLRSSLSDLTVDGSVAGLKTTRGTKTEGAVRSTNEQASTSKTSIKMNISEEHNSNDTDHRECLSSISIESLESIEAEKALLEQCIYSGMPTDKTEEALLEECISAGMPKSNSSSCINKSSEVSSIRKPQEPLSIQQHRTEETEQDRKSKNVNAASVAGSTPVPVLVNEMRPDMSTTAADVEERGLEQGRIGAKKESRETKNQEEKIENHQGTLPDKCSHFGGNFLTDLMKSGSNKSLSEVLGNSFENDFPYNDPVNCGSINDYFSKSCEESGQIVDKRMLDPDAMIESLDRFTAELVSQASHLTKDDDKYKVSTNDNTWNEDTSPNEVTFPSISGSAPNVVTFDSDKDISNKLENDEIDGMNEEEPQSNDFLSTNTNTLTESTLIAIEASKMVSEFKKEAEMSHSITSAASLELDCVRPPSQLNSLSNSTIGLDKSITKSPIVSRKKSLPVGFLVKRALSNAVNRTTSLESLESNSMNNLDCMNPPSDIQNVFDLTNSMTNIASISNETASIKTDFVINGITNNDSKNMEHHNPIFNVKQQYGTSVVNICGDFASVNQHSILENVNPPSIFNEITDLCNSLADIGTETICTENDVFEDCYTHMADTTLQDDTEFSDANSVTPIQSDLSSAESTPKRTKNLSKSMMTKQRRNLARDRFKTYTVAAEMVMKEEGEKLKLQQEENEQCAPDSTSEDFATVDDDKSEEATTYMSPTYTVSSSKLTPRERRQLDRSRFDTQVLDVAVTSALQNPDPQISGSYDSNANSPSPTRSKLSIRRNFMQKRLENKDRFKTRTLSESSFSPDISSASPPLEGDLHLQLQKEANLVLKTLRDTKTIVQEELLDCETLSLVSNDDDSEHNSGSSMNYRTFHKSWGVRQNNIPVITSEQNGLVNCQLNLTYDQETTENTEEQKLAKPKIVKPQEKLSEPENTSNEEQSKAIRGKRKPLYSKSNLSNKTVPKSIKPVKSMTSNLVKNVTSTFKSSTSLNNTNKETKTPTAKPPQIPNTRISSGYGRTSRNSSPKTSPARLPSAKTSPRHTAKGTPPLERQGTFTKDDVAKQGSRIPTPGSKIPTFASNKPTSSGSRTPNSSIPKSNIMRNSPKSVSSDRIQRSKISYNRSTSADSRDTSKHITSSLSSHSLKTETKVQNGAVKKPTVSTTAHPSKSNSSLTSNGTTSAKKQVTSKIASLWKKIEETKNKQTTKKDTRVWIQNEADAEQSKLIRSNTFDNEDKVILREKNDEADDPTKRVSRLGSFIVMEENEELLIQQTLNSKITTADVV